MKMNNNPTYCESIIDYGAYERKEEMVSLFYMIHRNL